MAAGFFFCISSQLVIDGICEIYYICKWSIQETAYESGFRQTADYLSERVRTEYG